MTLDDHLANALAERRAQHLYRQRRTLGSPQGARVVIDGRQVLAFSSNDYLGLANHPALAAALRDAAARYGLGAGASHLISGHSGEHQALEEELADFCGRRRALLFSTGYMANQGVISALVQRGDAVFQDRLNHASLLDGGLLSGARFRRYRHGDNDDLIRLLASTDSRHRLVVTDGVFSMDGDLAPLPAIASACNEHDAWLMVDDAHGFGVLGEQGGGVAEHYGLDVAQLPVLVGTLGKAFGTFGAFVAGSDDLIDYLIQFSRAYIYTTAMPAAVAAATRASLRLVREERWRRDKLQQLIQQFRAGARELGLQLMDSPTPVQPVLVGNDETAVRLGAELFELGFHVGAIRYPTVPRGQARLRITLTAAHSHDDVEQLLLTLQRVCRDLEPVS